MEAANRRAERGAAGMNQSDAPRLTVSLPFSPRDVRDGIARREPVMGVSRMVDNPQAILVSMRRPITDDELCALHDLLREWRP